jgi:hypothetical protein
MFYVASRAAAAAAIRFFVRVDLHKRSGNGSPAIVASWFAW